MLESLPSPADHYRQACLHMELAATTTDAVLAAACRTQAAIHATLATVPAATFSRAETTHQDVLTQARRGQAAEATDPSVHPGVKGDGRRPGSIDPARAGAR